MKNKFWTYLNKKGYYVILLLCILTVIGTTTFITNHNMHILNKINEQNSIDLDEEFGDYDLENVGTINAYQNDLDITTEDIEGAGSVIAENSDTNQSPENNEDKSIETKKEEIEQDIIVVSSNKNNEDTEREKQETEEEAKEVEETFSFNENTAIIWPISGQIVMDYSSDKLIFDKTLEQYRVHPAICIKPSEDTNVKAVARGKVEMIKNDPETGITVILNHGDGWRTIYGQLQKNVSVKQNDIVEQGQIIGEIGSPTKYSILLGEHVYFQVTKDNKPVNPKELLNNKN
ncbi:M23 family metallopeptidase [Defluviitalea phaphyphila]|uniref:M23 family metallopeptidase n=1 Tax=Defluviitalea phaphyphila TaxID=1473580 RepID=UPI00072FDC17|nr:M23 family metallopeptidase [Defluviitalea phaphyphila]